VVTNVLFSGCGVDGKDGGSGTKTIAESCESGISPRFSLSEVAIKRYWCCRISNPFGCRGRVRLLCRRSLERFLHEKIGWCPCLVKVFVFTLYLMVGVSWLVNKYNLIR
jgi:hypothetical protein